MSIGCYGMTQELVSIGYTNVDTRNVYCRLECDMYLVQYHFPPSYNIISSGGESISRKMGNSSTRL